MPHRPRVNPESIRTVNPSTWPQYPYNHAPRTPEQSAVREPDPKERRNYEKGVWLF